MKDNDLMPTGQFKGEAMINVPAWHLLWIYENNRCTKEVRKYVEDNMDVIKDQIKKEEKRFKK